MSPGQNDKTDAISATWSYLITNRKPHEQRRPRGRDSESYSLSTLRLVKFWLTYRLIACCMWIYCCRSGGRCCMSLHPWHHGCRALYSVGQQKYAGFIERTGGMAGACSDSHIIRLARFRTRPILLQIHRQLLRYAISCTVANIANIMTPEASRSIAWSAPEFVHFIRIDLFLFPSTTRLFGRCIL